MVVLIGTDGNDTLTGGVGDDELFGLDRDDVLIGGAGNDTLVAGDGRDTLRGGQGDDTYVFGVNEDTNRIFEDAGQDTLIFDESVAVWDIVFATSGIDRIVAISDFDANFGFGTTRIEINLAGGGIERFELFDGTRLIPGEVFTGTREAELLTGSDGDDLLTGDGGDDTLDGGVGNDRLLGEAGSDLLRGGAGADILFLTDASDTLEGGSGLDTALINLGNAATEGLMVNVADASGAVQTQGQLIMGGIERFNLSGTGFGDDVTGGSLGDILRGGLGLDTLSGLGGDDLIIDNRDGAVIDGGGGDDTIRYAELVTVQGGNGDDLIENDPDTFRTGGGTIDGGSGNDTISGLVQDRALDTVMRGGTGVDLLVLTEDSFEITNGPFTLDLSALSGGGSLTTTGGAQLSGFEAIDLRLNQSRTTFDVTATSGSDTVEIRQLGNHRIDGGAGDDVLSFTATSGNVTLIGGEGDDLLRVGAFSSGPHTFQGGAGNDTVELSLSVRDGTVIEGGDGFDLLVFNAGFAARFTDLQDALNSITANGFEQFDFGRAGFGDADETVTGTAFGDVLDVGLGNDTVEGLGGRDVLTGGAGDDLLIGGDGRDALFGGAGDDVLYGDGGPG